jgi:hypothetical protein
VEKNMPSIEEKRLAIEMADKIIQTRINLKNPAYYKQNNQAGDIAYWKEVYEECLRVVSPNDLNKN